MGQIGAKDIGADLAFGADLALSILQSSFVFLGELFEAVPRLNRSIPHSRAVASMRQDEAVASS